MQALNREPSASCKMRGTSCFDLFPHCYIFSSFDFHKWIPIGPTFFSCTFVQSLMIKKYCISMISFILTVYEVSRAKIVLMQQVRKRRLRKLEGLQKSSHWTKVRNETPWNSFQPKLDNIFFVLFPGTRSTFPWHYGLFDHRVRPSLVKKEKRRRTQKYKVLQHTVPSPLKSQTLMTSQASRHPSSCSMETLSFTSVRKTAWRTPCCPASSLALPQSWGRLV